VPSTLAGVDERTRRRTARLRRAAEALADGQSGVLCRRQLEEHELPRWLLQLEVRSGHWRRTGAQTVVVHNGPLSPAARRTVAAFEVSPRAALDGVTALQHRGVTALSDTALHVIVPRGARPHRTAGVVVHESRRFDEADVQVVDGARTVLPAVAAVHGALWAVTDRQATYLLLLVVQQRLAEAGQLLDAAAAVRRHARRGLLHRIAAEAAGGVHSLGELDVARAVRARGLPEPDRQVLRRRPSGTEYLDVRFDRYQLTLEVDGAGHDELMQRTADVLRDFRLVSEGDAVLRLPLAVFRLAEQQVLDRLEQVLVSRGWRRPAA
jgi:very-short-patch-repair endonuclease